MKPLVMMSVLLLCFNFYSSKGSAQSSDDAQKSFELEEDNVQIRDTEAERITAEKEAKHQQQIEAERQAQLKKILDEKAKVTKKAKVDIAIAEASRIKAEKQIQKQNAEIAKLKSQIETLKAQVATAEEKTKTAQQVVETGRQEIEKAKQDQFDLATRKRKADMANVLSSARIARMKIEYQRLVQQRNRLSAQTKQAEQTSYKNQATQDKLSRDISTAKGNQN